MRPQSGSQVEPGRGLWPGPGLPHPGAGREVGGHPAAGPSPQHLPQLSAEPQGGGESQPECGPVPGQTALPSPGGQDGPHHLSQSGRPAQPCPPGIPHPG